MNTETAPVWTSGFSDNLSTSVPLPLSYLNVALFSALVIVPSNTTNLPVSGFTLNVVLNVNLILLDVVAVDKNAPEKLFPSFLSIYVTVKVLFSYFVL